EYPAQWSSTGPQRRDLVCSQLPTDRDQGAYQVGHRQGEDQDRRENGARKHSDDFQGRVPCYQQFGQPPEFPHKDHKRKNNARENDRRIHGSKDELIDLAHRYEKRLAHALVPSKSARLRPAVRGGWPPGGGRPRRSTFTDSEPCEPVLV